MPEPELIDQRMLDAIRQLDDGGTGLLSQVIRLYFDASPDLLEKLRRGLEQGDLELTRLAAHSFKSSSANLGAARLAELCRRIEAAARDGALRPDTPCLEDVEREFRQVRAALELELRASAA